MADQRRTPGGDKLPFRVLIHWFACQHADCWRGCIGHHKLGEGLPEGQAVYTIQTARGLLGSWKSETAVTRGELWLYGELLAYWERSTPTQWPETVYRAHTEE